MAKTLYNYVASLWRMQEYDRRLALRPFTFVFTGQSLLLLLTQLGGNLADDGTPLHSNEQLYAAAHDWVSHGNPTTDGIIKFYYDYYQS